MERTEKIGLGIATAAHVLLFGALSTTFLSTPNPLKLNSPPIDVSMVDEIALKSAAPKISVEPPPPSEAPEKGPTEEAAPAPSPREVEPEVVPAPPPPKPAPPRKEAEKAKPKPPAPAKAAEKPKPVKEKPKETPAKPSNSTAKGKTDRPRGSLLGDDFLKGIQTEAPSKVKAAAPPATSVGPAQKAALDAEIRRQLKPYWKSPTGSDVELLRTTVAVELNRDGSISGAPEIFETTGQTASNRSQVKLHQEQAIKAIKLASPFKLPADLYDGWKSLRIAFDKRLSQ
ncbi:cell envelope biogenesis protein TolA [Sphingobium phenoxybenzoativorans]|uniref:cell envelope biogenesis protein TolA n=1 Tax=Sphingobium phenoxybenzoativorans TaxID=1592790 RepID=UPI0008727EEB|nr:cell envelope biogenesis protein TolA [Sphingobium phenoxybenzoativorans]